MQASRLLLALTLVVPLVTRAWAELPGSDWLPESALVKQMQAVGFSEIIVWADDGQWEGEALKDSRLVEFHADAHSGKVTQVRPKDAQSSAN